MIEDITHLLQKKKKKKKQETIMLGNEGLAMLEANTGSGADQRAVYDFVRSVARPNSCGHWNAAHSRVASNALFSDPGGHHQHPYQDPIHNMASTMRSGGGGDHLEGTHHTKQAKRSSLMRRGSVTQRFTCYETEEGWNTSTKTPTPVRDLVLVVVLVLCIDLFELDAFF